MKSELEVVQDWASLGCNWAVLFDSARLLPEKLTVYTTLVGLLNARNYNFGGEFVEAMIRQLKETLKSNLYNEAVYLVCQLSCRQYVKYQAVCFTLTLLFSGAFPLRLGQLSCDRRSLNGGHVRKLCQCYSRGRCSTGRCTDRAVVKRNSWPASHPLNGLCWWTVIISMA